MSHCQLVSWDAALRAQEGLVVSSFHLSCRTWSFCLEILAESIVLEGSFASLCNKIPLLVRGRREWSGGLAGYWLEWEPLGLMREKLWRPGRWEAEGPLQLGPHTHKLKPALFQHVQCQKENQKLSEQLALLKEENKALYEEGVRLLNQKDLYVR